jgi:hypothetical protein
LSLFVSSFSFSLFPSHFNVNFCSKTSSPHLRKKSFPFQHFSSELMKQKRFFLQLCLKYHLLLLILSSWSLSNKHFFFVFSTFNRM